MVLSQVKYYTPEEVPCRCMAPQQSRHLPGTGTLLVRPIACAEMPSQSVQVRQHCSYDDLWVVIFGQIFDLTELVRLSRGSEVMPMVDAAGTDISHWFDGATEDIRMHVTPVTEEVAPYTPRRNGG